MACGPEAEGTLGLNRATLFKTETAPPWTDAPSGARLEKVEVRLPKTLNDSSREREVQTRSASEGDLRLIRAAWKYQKHIRPQIRRDYPLNLSILLGGGKETNKDSLSSGERTGRSPARNPARRRAGKCRVWEAPLSRSAVLRVQVSLERGHRPQRVPGP